MLNRLPELTAFTQAIALCGFYTGEEGIGLPSSDESATGNLNALADLHLFYYRIDRNNPTEVEKFYPFTDDSLRRLIRLAHEHGVRILPVIHNLLYERN